jgi:hypothetical protein
MKPITYAEIEAAANEFSQKTGVNIDPFVLYRLAAQIKIAAEEFRKVGSALSVFRSPKSKHSKYFHKS